MIRQRCARCGKRLKKGGVSYRFRAELISAFDGYIYETPGKIEDKLEKIEKATEGLSSEDLEEQVYKKYEYLVCAECRDILDDFIEQKDLQ